MSLRSKPNREGEAPAEPERDGRELPEGWTVAPVGDILNLVNGCPFKPSHWKQTGLPIIRIQSLNNPNAPFNYCTDKMPEKYRVRNGDLLFAWSGTPGTSFGAHIWESGDAWLNQHIFRVEFDKTIFSSRSRVRMSLNPHSSIAISTMPM